MASVTISGAFNGATPFDELHDADLNVDQVYRGGRAGNIGDDPIAALIHKVGDQRGVGNQGGFREAKYRRETRLVVLYTSGEEPDWPDELDVYSGTFVYYGDNRSPGRDLHNTTRGGNRLLAETFQRSRLTAEDRASAPPFLLFEKVGVWRDVRFRGLLAPGGATLSTEQELVAIWRSTGGQRFQNYRAHFTVLDVPQVSRDWINDLMLGKPLAASCPAAWRSWVEHRTYQALNAPPTVIVRTKAQQLPDTASDLEMLRVLHDHFEPRPTDFEQFAADLWERSEAHVDKIDVTRPWRDGGRDAVGDFLIGPASDPVAVEFALEAKCYGLGNSVGVRETSRLISRLRHRQFGVLVTTSFLHPQAYKEIREDGHPVVVIAGVDLIRMLKKQHVQTAHELRELLEQQYPDSSGA